MLILFSDLYLTNAIFFSQKGRFSIDIPILKITLKISIKYINKIFQKKPII